MMSSCGVSRRISTSEVAGNARFFAGVYPEPRRRAQNDIGARLATATQSRPTEGCGAKPVATLLRKIIEKEPRVEIEWADYPIRPNVPNHQRAAVNVV